MSKSSYIVVASKLDELKEKLPGTKYVSVDYTVNSSKKVVESLNDLKKAIGAVGFFRGGLFSKVELALETFYGYKDLVEKLQAEHGTGAMITEPLDDEAIKDSGFEAPVFERF